MTKWRTLLLATASFNLSFLIWFSFAPMMSPIREDFGLSLAAAGILASAAIWMAPAGRIITGWLSDRWGAPTVFAVVLVYVGVFSIASGLVSTDRYWLFFALRLVVGTAGITFVIGIQHIAQWFPNEQFGTAEGLYAGFGNAGAAGGALLLPQFFGTDWRTAFIVTGALSILFGVVYFVVGEDASTEEKAQKTKESATLKNVAHVATRYGVIVLSLAYVMSFGLELSMNGWLPTYFEEGFGSNLAIAGLFAATFSVAAGVLRPIGGYVSDYLARNEKNIIPFFEGRYREQWTFVCLVAIVLLLGAMTFAGRTGSVLLVVGVGFLVGTSAGWAEGAIFAQVPAMFPDRTGAAAGLVGGIGTFGGIGYPLVYTYAAEAGAIHMGYVVVAATMIPVVVMSAWVFQPKIAEVANTEGVVFGSETATVEKAPPTDDD